MPDKKTPKFIQIEKTFSAYLRDPENQPKPKGIDADQINVYKELIFNNISSILENCFPVIYSILEGTQWDQLIRSFLSSHPATRPLFVELPIEFLEFVETRQKNTEDYSFLYELAHYEWVELELELSQDKLSTSHPPVDLLAENLNVSPLVRLLHYQYPVQKIGKDYLPTKPSPVYLIVYRDKDDHVKFLETNGVSARLLAILSNNPQISGYQALERIAKELKHPDPETMITFGQDILEQFLGLGIIYS